MQKFRIFAGAFLAGITLLSAQAPAPQQPAAPATEISVVIRGDIGAPPHYAVPDFVALTNEKETQDAARLIAQVLWTDLSFEREYDMIPRDTYGTIEQSGASDTIAFDR